MKNPTSQNQPRSEIALMETNLPSGSTKVHARRRGIDERGDPQLTTRELEVLRLIFQELTNIEIGDKLCLSPRTVETYRRTMMEKVGVRNTVGLVLFALRNGVVRLEAVQK